MIRHAYLIMAHNEFDVLYRLLLAIDDIRNDVYIHFDKKIKQIPKIKLNNAKLFILKNRIDVSWGDFSQIKCEFLLFRQSYENGPYRYYHILSGVDIPIKSQDAIHRFFAQNAGKEFVGFTQGDIKNEIDKKVRRIHLFPRYFKGQNSFLFWGIKSVRFLFLQLQIIFGIRRNRNINFKKGTNWVSVTDDFVCYLLPKFNEVLKLYHHSFCADEIFLHTICWNSKFKKNIYDSRDEKNGSMRLIRWENNQLIDWTNDDFDEIINSNAIFARKFNSQNIDVVNRIMKTIL